MRKNVRRAEEVRKLSVVLAVVVFTTFGATAGVEAPYVSAAPSCEGAKIVGEGSSVQAIAQKSIWGPGIASICGHEVLALYNSEGSAQALFHWGFFDKERHGGESFAATDAAPNAAHIENAEWAGGSRVQVIPVSQTALTAIVNPPANCEIEEITNRELEHVFAGTKKTWGAIPTAFGAGCAGSPITRVVRPNAPVDFLHPIRGAGTTYQFKNYLYQINKTELSCTQGSKIGLLTWQQLEEIRGLNESPPSAFNPNISWPESGVAGCSATQLSSISEPEENTDAALVKYVNSTDGSFSYAALPDIEAYRTGDTHWLRLQNNGLVKLANATMAEPVIESTTRPIAELPNIPFQLTGGSARKAKA